MRNQTVWALSLALWLAVAGLVAASGPPPPNDLCADSIPIDDGVTPFSTVGASTDGQPMPQHPSCDLLGDDNVNQDIWYDYTATCSGLLTVSTCSDADYDTKVAIYYWIDGIDCPATTDLLACNDEADGCSGFTSILQALVEAGEVYKLRVGGFSKHSGTGNLTITCAAGACEGADGECCDPGGNGSPGCSDPQCCQLVCAMDAYCCNVQWDALCAVAAVDTCPICGVDRCPKGSVVWIDPPDLVVDAGQPFDVNGGSLQGLQRMIIEFPQGVGPGGIADDCFTLCENDDGGWGQNSVNSLIDNGDGTYTVLLARPITPLAVTTIVYTDDDSVPWTGAFTAHPANVNGDNAAGSIDILDLIDFLNGVLVLPWGVYSCDVDRSGACNSADILTVIDLLNGADKFPVYNGTALPGNTDCP